MKFYRFCLLLFLLLAGVRMNADGGDVLERIIQLPKAKATIYSLLGNISEQSGYLFIYDSKIINNDSVVSVKKRNCTLRQAILEIVGGKNMDLKVLGHHILITHTTEKTLAKGGQTSSAHSMSTITGKLLDKETGEPIGNASVLLQGTSLGNITNGNGEFRVHLPDSLKNRLLVFSHLGYVGQSVEVSALEGRSNVISLVPKVIPLQEVLIRLVDPKKLLREMIERRNYNYSSAPVYLTTFYREGVQVKNNFQSLTEAVFKVYKSSAIDSDAADQVKLLKMSRIDNSKKTDSLIAKIRSGVEACLQLDIIKNIPDFLSLESNNEFYAYTSGGIVTVDDRMANVVCFEQKKGIEEPLFRGELYIDSENSALLQARFEINPQYVKKATHFFVIRQAQKIRLTTQKIVYTISYKPWKGIYYIHHIQGDIYFKMRKKRILAANSTLRTWFEMVTCRIDDKNVVRFPRAQRLPTHTILADTDFKYDENFWEDFNVIPLEDELNRIIEKVTLKIEQTDNL